MTTTPHDARLEDENADEPTPVAPETPTDAQAPDAPDTPIDLQFELEKAKEKMAEFQDQALRAVAEMENVRRRSAEEVTKARKFAIESFAESLVPVRDSLEAALTQTDQSNEDFRTGIDATLKQLAGAFERNHLKEIAPATGEKFDPHHHQAIATVPSEQEANTVVAVLQKGYLIADRVLRPALVTVAA
uniref:nucleotide exchange factor GrpE n=1 Tax=Orrella sp. TaxID=1921583 RepID=UPI004047DD1F